MTKREAVIERLREAIEDGKDAFYIIPLRKKLALEILQELEGGTVNHSEGTQPNPTAAGV